MMIMEKRIVTAKEKRQRSFLLKAPLLAFPVLTLLFWGMGGGRTVAGMGRVVAKGFNMRLPGPNLRHMGQPDKMAYYEKAARDSIAARQRDKLQDNYARMLGIKVIDSAAESPEANIRKVQQKLDEVRRALVSPGGLSVTAAPVRSLHSVREAGQTQSVTRMPEMDRLEGMMATLRQDKGDPELAQLGQLLDKLADVQRPHAELKRDSIRTAERVAVRRALAAVAILPDEDDTTGLPDSTAIPASVADEQTVVSGDELRLELARDITIGGRLIPRGTAVYGTVALNGQRLRVAITAIEWRERVYAVNWQVDGEDGLPGIYIPGAPVSDAVRETAAQETGAIGPEMLSTTLAGQAAGAGLTLARSLVGKKLRPVKVTVPAGYTVICHVKNEVP
jgi:hypothetical protein